MIKFIIWQTPYVGYFIVILKICFISEVEMMPLSMSNTGESQVIKKIGGKEEVRSFLEKLGFVVGGEVTVVSEIAGNMIVNVKGARVAIGKDMANKIMV